MADKNVDIELDFQALAEKVKIEEEVALLDPAEKKVGVRSTLFTLGKDPRLSTEPNITAPDLRLLAHMKDGLKNSLVEVSWRIARSDVDRAGVVGFNIWRRKVPRKKFMRENRRRGAPQHRFSTVGFSRLGRHITRRGKFAPESKALFQVEKSTLNPVDVNVRTAELQSVSRARYQSSLNLPLPPSRNFGSPLDGRNKIANTANFTQYFNDKRFAKVGFVSYESFLAKEKTKFVQVTNREVVDLSYKDRSVVLGQGYEYYVTSVPKDIRQSVQSNSVSIFVEDVSPVRPPQQLMAKIIEATRVRVSVVLDKRDDVGRVLVYKRSEGEAFFTQIAVLQNICDCVNFIDSGVGYGQNYTYRVFAESIHGVLSEPKEISVDVLTQKITPRGRSNILKTPILNVVQDQNSDSLKITIAANDSKIAFYELNRRDLTINEKKFVVPGPETTNLGGVGWDTNKFFVKKTRNLLNTKLKNNRDLFSRRTTTEEINFVDNIVQSGHVYEYRAQGIDLFGNVSSYVLATVRAKGRAPVRTPINVRVDILRSHPFRLKLSWQNDNELTLFTRDELFEVESPLNPDDVKFLYQVQRRKKGETRYESFPITANSFLIDEVPSRDIVPFLQKKVKDTYTRVPNIDSFTTTKGVTTRVGGEASVESASGLFEFKDAPTRPFQTPPFLEENDVYFYRVAAIRRINGVDEFSNYSEEFKIFSTSDLASPGDFKVEVLNMRVAPLTGILTWTTDQNDARPDHWIIERKFDVETDTFTCIGNAYLEEKFFDKDLQIGNSYIYRIKSVDNFGRESDFFEARLTL